MTAHENVVEAAVAAARPLRQLPAHVRADALRHVAAGLTADAEKWAGAITTETGKPISWSRTEVARAAHILVIAAEKAARLSPTTHRLDGHPSGSGRLALVKRVPRGPVLAITPFNFPLHLVVHKVAPAIALGAPVIVKPSPRAPSSSLLLERLFAETSLPAGSVGVTTVDGDALESLVRDPRLPVISFTGSDVVGWNIVDAVPRKHVTVELGGNGAAVIAPDYTSDDDLEYAASRIALFSNYAGGQACTSPQRVFVPAEHFDRAARALVHATERQVVGDPWDDATDIGPLVDAAAVARISSWVDDAVAAGARVLTGGSVIELPSGAVTFAPTVLADVPSDSPLTVDEVFGPVVQLLPYDSIGDAFAQVNDSRFGLHAGVFTRDVTLAFRAFDELEVGGVVIGDAPTYRSDYPPFGGTKDSGQGREGIRAAIEDFSYERVLTLSDVVL